MFTFSASDKHRNCVASHTEWNISFFNTLSTSLQGSFSIREPVTALYRVCGSRALPSTMWLTCFFFFFNFFTIAPGESRRGGHYSSRWPRPFIIEPNLYQPSPPSDSTLPPCHSPCATELVSLDYQYRELATKRRRRRSKKGEEAAYSSY